MKMQIIYTCPIQVKSAVDIVTMRGTFVYLCCEIYLILNILLYYDIINILAWNSGVAWKDSYARFL